MDTKVTDSDIMDLQEEMQRAGDKIRSRVCDVALGRDPFVAEARGAMRDWGKAECRAECERVILLARADAEAGAAELGECHEPLATLGALCSVCRRVQHNDDVARGVSPCCDAPLEYHHTDPVVRP